MERFIQKVDGSQEIFDEEKIKISLLRAGANEDIAYSIIQKVKEQLKGELIKAKDVYKLALGYLKKKQPNIAIKYTLKKAIMDFGPTGYVFEKYIGKILQEYGYKTQVSKIIKGFMKLSYWATRIKKTKIKLKTNMKVACEPDCISSKAIPDQLKSIPSGRIFCATSSIALIACPVLYPGFGEPLISVDLNIL